MATFVSSLVLVEGSDVDGRETELSLLLTLLDGTGDKRKTEGVLEVVLLSLVRGCGVTLRVPLADIA